MRTPLSDGAFQIFSLINFTNNNNDDNFPGLSATHVEVTDDLVQKALLSSGSTESRKRENTRGSRSEERGSGTRQVNNYNSHDPAK